MLITIKSYFYLERLEVMENQQLKIVFLVGETIEVEFKRCGNF
jgi:hypothetical protein